MVKTLNNFFLLFIALFLFGACQQKQVMVGLLVSDANRQTAELTALYEYIESGQNMRCEYIEVNDSSRLYGYCLLYTSDAADEL